MNFAYVRIEGAVAAYPSLDTEDGYLSFRVQDSSGEMRVAAYRGAVTELLARRRIPMPGDRVTVEGTLRVRDDEPALTLNAAEALVIAAGEPHPVQLTALDALKIGDLAATGGQVRRVRDASTTLRIATLRNGGAVADVLFPLELQNLFGAPPELEPGDWVSVTGGVDEFRDQKQLLPARAQDVVLWPSAQPFDYRPVSALSKRMVGQWVAVQGLVEDMRPLENGMRIDVRDEAGDAITLVMFDSWNSVPFSQTLAPGDMLGAQGELAEYRGALELLPEMGIDLVKLDQ